MDKTVAITITDTGAGVPTDQLEAIFQRFHRLDPARTNQADGGSGLGLTIARAVVEDHHGSLTAHSAGPGLGAAFTVMLPTVDQ